MSEEHIFDLLPAYALECLDDDDLIKVARHLPHCAICQGELLRYQETVEKLALAAPVLDPPSDLKHKVINRVEQKVDRRAAPQQAEMPRPGILQTLQNLFTRPVSLALGAIMLLAVVLLGINNLALSRQVNSLQAHVPPGNIQIVRLNGTENARQTTGYMMVFKNENYGTLAVEDAPVLDSGQQYQLWLIKDGKRTSGGVFSVNESGYGVLKVSASQPLDQFQSFGITVEPAGGSPAPTGKKVLGGTL